MNFLHLWINSGRLRHIMVGTAQLNGSFPIIIIGLGIHIHPTQTCKTQENRSEEQG